MLLRCVNSAFFLSHDFRRDVELYLVLLGEPDPPKTIRLHGNELRYLNPDERSTGALIRNALMKKLEREIENEVRSTPGFYISRSSLKDVLTKLAGISGLVYLREDGKPLESVNTKDDLTFILSDDKNMTEEEEEQILGFDPKIYSLGKTIYHSDHCITNVLWILDNKN